MSYPDPYGSYDAASVHTAALILVVWHLSHQYPCRTSHVRFVQDAPAAVHLMPLTESCASTGVLCGAVLCIASFPPHLSCPYACLHTNLQ
jgi:hypothetical protein